MSNSENLELKLALLDKHSRQHTELRQKIHLTTERYVTLMFALVALITSDLLNFSSHAKLRVMICILVVCVMLSIIYMIIKDNRSSLRNAKIVSAINRDLGLFVKGKVINSIVLYPEQWKDWGNEPGIKGSILHISIVVLSTALFLVAVFLKS